MDKRLDNHDRRFDELLAASHKDTLEILRTMSNLYERIAVVQDRQQRS